MLKKIAVPGKNSQLTDFSRKRSRFFKWLKSCSQGGRSLNRYDPDHAPNPEQWLTLDEQARIHLAEEYHRAKRIKLPNIKAHAVFHAIIENQIAENLESVVRAMARLTAEGLSRHESIHAIASVLAEHISELFSASADEKHSAAIYSAAVERLTARSLRGG